MFQPVATRTARAEYRPTCQGTRCRRAHRSGGKRFGNWHRSKVRHNKKTGASVVGLDAPVGDKGLDKLSIYPAAGIVYDLFDFKLIVGHSLLFLKQEAEHSQDVKDPAMLR